MVELKWPLSHNTSYLEANQTNHITTYELIFMPPATPGVFIHGVFGKWQGGHTSHQSKVTWVNSLAAFAELKPG